MRTAVFTGALICAFMACSRTSAQQAKRPAQTDVVATVGPTPITLAEVDDKALQMPVSSFGSVKVAVALYQARRLAVEELVADRLMDAAARQQGLTRAALVEKEITAKIRPVTDDDIGFWYQTNQARVQGATLEQARQPIKTFLTEQRMQEIRDAYLADLKSKTPVRISLDPPRQVIAQTAAPTQGPASAPIELIEFSDFQCPFCFRATPTVNQVMSTYGDKIRRVYRHYPLPNHPNARPAAEASVCAAEQGKFWPYHDRLFADPSKLSQDDLKQDAAALGLDTAKFDSCVDSHKLKATVDADLQAGQEAGVDGTPAFFINGRMVSGAQPFEVFKRIIDEELELKKR